MINKVTLDLSVLATNPTGRNDGLLVPIGYRPDGPNIARACSLQGLHLAAWKNDVAGIRKLIATGANPNERDRAGRTPLHVAAFGSHDDAVAELVKGGADPNTLENDKYDIVTIAAVANDRQLVERAIKLGADPRNITSIYDGTALIAAAHLGHVEVVKF